jgi:hypothetical protein
VTGATVWIAAVAYTLPHPFDLAYAHLILLLGVLVIVPLGLCIVPRGPAESWPERLMHAVRALQLPAALVFALAFLLPQGLPAASLAAPWALLLAVLALAALGRVYQRGLRPIALLTIDAGLVLVVVGGLWAVADRLGIRPLQFDAVIVLLTGIHFHYAGFALPILTGLAAQRLPGRIATMACVGVMAGVPLTATGITTSQLELPLAIETGAVWLTSIAGLLTAWLYLRLATDRSERTLPRVLWGVAAVALAFSMVLAALYGTRHFAALAWLDIPWMRALHGTANAFGFALLGLLGWTELRARSRHHGVIPS